MCLYIITLKNEDGGENMSYASHVKEELANISELSSSGKMALLEALLRLNGEIQIGHGELGVSFTSSNAAVSRTFLALVKELYKCDVELIQKDTNYLKKLKQYIVRITSQSETIVEEFSLMSNISPNREEILNNEQAMSAYLRGAFLARGSVNDPKTSAYHLEIVTSNEIEAIFIQRLMNYFNLNAKITKRRKDLVVYLKDVQMIKDFLRIIGTVKAVFELEDIIIKRVFASDINRAMNCELANETKTMDAANEQLKYIRYLEYHYPLDKLDSKILMIMKVRKDNPEASFQDLIKIIEDVYGEQITKSGINHRFRKIKEIAIEHAKLRKE